MAEEALIVEAVIILKATKAPVVYGDPVPWNRSGLVLPPNWKLKPSQDREKEILGNRKGRVICNGISSVFTLLALALSITFMGYGNTDAFAIFGMIAAGIQIIFIITGFTSVKNPSGWLLLLNFMTLGVTGTTIGCNIYALVQFFNLDLTFPLMPQIRVWFIGLLFTSTAAFTINFAVMIAMLILLCTYRTYM